MHRFNVATLGKPSPFYSHAAKSAGLLSIAGMLGEGETFEEQCEGAYRRVLAVLQLRIDSSTAATPTRHSATMRMREATARWRAGPLSGSRSAAASSSA